MFRSTLWIKIRSEIFDRDWIGPLSLSVVVWFVSNAKSSCEVYICNGFSFKQFKCHKHQIPKYNYKYSNKHIIVILVLITFTKCLDQHFELKIKSETMMWTFISFEQNGLSLR